VSEGQALKRPGGSVAKHRVVALEAERDALTARVAHLEYENDQLRRALGAISDIALRARGDDPYERRAR
jgi:hypothetical protein